MHCNNANIYCDLLLYTSSLKLIMFLLLSALPFCLLNCFALNCECIKKRKEKLWPVFANCTSYLFTGTENTASEISDWTDSQWLLSQWDQGCQSMLVPSCRMMHVVRPMVVLLCLLLYADAESKLITHLCIVLAIVNNFVFSWWLLRLLEWVSFWVILQKLRGPL